MKQKPQQPPHDKKRQGFELMGLFHCVVKRGG
jgi:hypothetical protein